MSSEGGSGSGEARAGRWADAPILPELPPQPVELIQVRGAQRLRVFNVDAPNVASRRGFDEAVAVAWARLPDGDWAALLGWLSGWRGEDGRTTGRARHAWCRILPDRTQAMPIWPQTNPEHEWHGHHREGEFAQAVWDAIETLPEELREKAAVPYEPDDAAASEQP